MATTLAKTLTLAALVVAGPSFAACTPTPPRQFFDSDCERPPASVPKELTADPNVDIVLVDRVYPTMLDGNEVITWDGWLAHSALSHSFFCHRSERSIAALETAPGLHKLDVLIRVFGNPDTRYDHMVFDVKYARTIDVPESGVLVLNLEISLGDAPQSAGGTSLPPPKLKVTDQVLPAVPPKARP